MFDIRSSQLCDLFGCDSKKESQSELWLSEKSV